METGKKEWSTLCSRQATRSYLLDQIESAEIVVGSTDVQLVQEATEGMSEFETVAVVPLFHCQCFLLVI